MSLIYIDPVTKNAKFDLDHALRERHMMVVPVDPGKDEFTPLLKKWHGEFAKRYVGQKINEDVVKRMDADIHKMLLAALEKGYVRHIL